MVSNENVLIFPLQKENESELKIFVLTYRKSIWFQFQIKFFEFDFTKEKIGVNFFFSQNINSGLL